jgi:bla regulator protein blaR1
LEIILAHELAHIKQADYIINILQSIIEVFFFFNPAVWWISKTIRKEREYSCDDLAIEVCGNSLTLAKALLFVKKSEQLETTIAMASIRDNNSLMGRIKRMTNKTEKKQYGSVFAIIPALLFVFIFAFASSEHLGKNENLSAIEIAQPAVGVSSAVIGDDDRNQFSFRENNINWKAFFEKGKLVELYKNGEKIPKEQFSKYEDLIYKRYAEFEEEMAELDVDMDELEIDMKQLKVDLEDMKNIKIDFDNEEFMEEMETMKHELNRELSKLKDLDFNINIDIDLDELNESLKNIKVDLSGFDEEMADLKIELTGLKKELRVLKRFMHNLKEGLVDDGYLEDDDDDFDLDLSREEMILNGKQLPESAHKKYLKLYKEHFGEELEDEFRISN